MKKYSAENNLPAMSFYKVRLFTLILIIGICSLAYEFTFSKLSSDLLGSSYTQWALIIGLMLFTMGLGADWQKRIKDKNLFKTFFYAEILLTFLGGWGPVFLYYIFGENRTYYPLAQFSLTGFVGFIIGMEIPILLRLNTTEDSVLKVNLAKVFRLDYFGGFIGSLLWVYVLINFSTTILQVGFTLALINLFGLSLSLTLFKNYTYALKKQKVIFWGLIITTTFIHSLGLFFSPKITPFLEQKLFKDKIIFSKNSQYQNIVLTESPNQHYFLYLNGHLQFSSRDEYIYHEYLVHPAMQLAKEKKKILILGGGDGLAARQVLKYPSVEYILLVDLDPSITSLAKHNPILTSINQNSLNNAKVVELKSRGIFFNSQRKEILLPNQNSINSENINHPPKDKSAQLSFEIINLDAYLLVQDIIGSFDVIILDFPDPHDIELGKLYSLSFYSFLKNKLNPGGILVQQSSSPFYAKETFLIIGNTLKKAGYSIKPYRAVVPSFGIWGWHLAYLPAEEEKITNLSFSHLNQLDLQYLTPQLIKNSFDFPKDYFSANKNNYNSIINNKAYQAYLKNLKNF